MKITKRKFDFIFVVIMTTLLLILSHFDLLEKYIQFALIPIFIAYKLGQYSERKLEN